MAQLEAEGDDLITWNNAIVERRDGKLRAYAPNYGIPLLDRKANGCRQCAGVEVLPVRADLVILEGGAVRCLSNVFLQE